MAIQVNSKGNTFARSLISSGDIDFDSSWSFTAADGNKLLGEKGDDWDNYGKHFLVVDNEAESKTKARFKFPFAKNGKIYMSAIRAIKSRAGQQKYDNVSAAADKLWDLLKKKQEKRMKKEVMEYRTMEFRDLDEAEGTVIAYLTQWDTLDGKGSIFRKGSFKKTFQERGNKIRHIWNHDQSKLIGKVIDHGEDSYGPWVKGKFNLETQDGREAFAHVRAGDVDAYSFGFNTIIDRIENGIRNIYEVRVMEVGPVIFPANEKAVISEVRATDLQETKNGIDLERGGYAWMDALHRTMDDIYWKSNSEDWVSLMDAAISDFHEAYLNWLSAKVDHLQEKDGDGPIESRALAREIEHRKTNPLSDAVRKTMSHDENEVVKTTALTVSEFRSLVDGELLPVKSRYKLDELPDEVREQHQLLRSKAVETLCSELRERDMSNAEKTRLSALLGLEVVETPVSGCIDSIRELRSTLNKGE